MKYYLLHVLIILILGGSNLLRCQEISNEEKIKVASMVAEKIEAIYPYSDISKKVVDGITEELNRNGFNSINSYAEFATKMTELIEGLSNDKHLDLIFNPSLAIKMKSGATNDNLIAEEEAEIEKWKNYGFEELSILDGNIGYLNLSVFFDLVYASNTAEHTMGYFANCNGLIIDLRHNGGGWSEMVTFLLSYFINPPGPGTIRVQLSTLDSSYYTEYIPPVVNGKRLLNIPVYILISRATASAAESFTTNMSFFNKNVTTIGEKTRGAENPIDYTFIDENFILQIPSYKILYSLNPYSWEGKGIEPDISVEAANAKEYAHKLMLKELFRDCKDSLSKSKYQWALDGLEASYDNVEIRLLKELTGSYGKYEVYLEDGEIYIIYNAGPARKLIPINEKYFIVDGIQYYRIEFLNDEHGQRMKRIFYYGNVQEISKEK